MRGLWPWIEQASKRLHRNLLAIALATASPGPSRARSRISAEDYAPSGVTRAGAANVGSSEVKAPLNNFPPRSAARCPRYCKLHEGQRGLCFVRARQGDQMVLTTYGRSSGFCIDPIEKKPLNHFLPGTPVLSFGTAGCNLTCKFCQNWDISKARNFDRIQELASPEAIAEAAVQSGCRSVAFTYNDPVIFLEYAVDVAQACRDRGIKTVAVSAGYISPEPRIEFFRHMDAANIDLKGFTEGFYKNSLFG